MRGDGAKLRCDPAAILERDSSLERVSGAGMLAGLRAAAPLPLCPPSCCSRAPAAVIPCSGLKISPGAAAAHQHLELVINNPGEAHTGPSRLLREEVGPPPSPCPWRGGWTHGGMRETGRSSPYPLAAQGN